MKINGYYDSRDLELQTSSEEIKNFFKNHPLINRTDESDHLNAIRFVQNEFIDFSNMEFNSYLSAILTDFLRGKLIGQNRSFTFETVMSSPDKLSILQNSRNAGYRNYLYYVATEDPDVNIKRVQNRIRSGGHSVPETKIIERYYRSLNLLLDAIILTNRAYIFDNSGQTNIWIAEITEGRD